MDKKFPYISKFESCVSYGGIFNKSSLYSQASLEGLRCLIPNSEVDISNNVDLLSFAANACSISIANKNDDVMDAETAIKAHSFFKNKMINSEHDRKKIIGHIITSALTDYKTSSIISEEEALSLKSPFNISVGGVVYRILDRDYAQMLEESSDKESSLYKKISLSFEVGMADYRLAIGSRNLFEAEIISEPKRIKELQGNLRVYGGNGKLKDGTSVYRIIGKDCLPLGVALTTQPAAIMAPGLITHNSPSQEEEKQSSTTFFGGFFNNFDKDKKTSVTTIKTKDMEKFELILEEIKASLLENKVKETTIAGITKDISEQIRVASEDYVKKIAEKEAEKISAETALAKIKATQEAQAIELADTREKLSTLEAKASAEAAANLFSVRMSEMDAEFDLDDEDRQVLASDIKALDETEAAFVLFKKKAGVLMKDKNKEAKKKKDEEAKASIDKAVELKLTELAKASTKTLSEKELAEKALEEAKASKSSVTLPNNNQSQSEQQGFKEKFAAAFAKENVTISK